jgi:hypothetical protein
VSVRALADDPFQAKCPSCGRAVAITRDRKLAQHVAWNHPAARRKPGSRARVKTWAAHDKATKPCVGSGLEVLSAP